MCEVFVFLHRATSGPRPGPDRASAGPRADYAKAYHRHWADAWLTASFCGPSEKSIEYRLCFGRITEVFPTKWRKRGTRGNWTSLAARWFMHLMLAFQHVIRKRASQHLGLNPFLFESNRNGL